MSHPYSHPAARALLERVALAFIQDDVYLVVDRHLLFVCGGPVDCPIPPETASLRKRFLKYAELELQNFRVFLAEAAANDIFESSAPTFLNLAIFENFIAEFADCIVLFPESPGSLAEIGFFASSERLRKKLLVANDMGVQGKDSFINNGPLALVNAESEFRSVIQIDTTTADFSPIKDRLKRFPHKRRHRFEFASYADMPSIARFAVVLESIRLFSPISIDGLHFLITSIFGDADLSEVKHLVSLAVAVQYLRRIGPLEDLFDLMPGVNTLFVLPDNDGENLRIDIVDFYKRYVQTNYRLIEAAA